MIYKESNPLQDTPTESILRIVNVAIYTLAKRGGGSKRNICPCEWGESGQRKKIVVLARIYKRGFCTH